MKIFRSLFKRGGLIFLLLSLIFGSIAVAAEVSGRRVEAEKKEIVNSLEPTLKRIREAASGVETITSTMVQEKYLKAFAEVLKAHGRFAFERPDCWRWELLEPVISGLSVCGDKGRRWHEKGGQPQSFTLADEPWLRHFATQVTAWTTADFGYLKKQYAIVLLKSEPPSLELTPREAAARSLIASLEITFSVDYRYVTSIIIREVDGDYTAISFLDVNINQPLPEDSFR